MTTGPVASSRAPVLVDFALQGGGAHGAFTWGVLDRLLEEPWLGIDGISAPRPGAMNAAVLVDGLPQRRRRRARRAGEFLAPRLQAAVLSPFRRSRSTCCWAAGRSTIRPCSSPWI
jgi:NTE family protein